MSGSPSLQCNSNNRNSNSNIMIIAIIVVLSIVVTTILVPIIIILNNNNNNNNTNNNNNDDDNDDNNDDIISAFHLLMSQVQQQCLLVASLSDRFVTCKAKDTRRPQRFVPHACRHTACMITHSLVSARLPSPAVLVWTGHPKLPCRPSGPPYL